VSGTNILKRAKLQLSTMNIQEDLQLKNEENIQKVQKVTHSNCFTVHKVAEEARISKTV
jgi:predicted transcriptional regulator